MSFYGQYAFNLFFNAAGSFLVGLIVVFAVIKFFRIDQSRWKLGLYFLPFVKIIWDLFARRIPSSSIVYSGLDPLSFARKSQSISIGTGFNAFAPVLNVVFHANAPDGKRYSTSVADYLFAYTRNHLGQNVPYLILGAALLVSLVLLTKRVILAYLFEQQRKQWRMTDSSLSALTCGSRKVDVYTSPHYEGTPFTGGVFHPYICIPEKTHLLLTAEERHAVLEHEMGHIRQWDLAGTFFIQALGDLFWFVPGYKLFGKKIDRLREILADDFAVKHGAKPEHLASALLRLLNTQTGSSSMVLYSAFFREPHVLQERVKRLVGPASVPRPRWGWNRIGIKILVTALTVGTVMFSTFGENHEVSVIEVSSWLDLLPAGIASILRMGGFH